MRNTEEGGRDRKVFHFLPLLTNCWQPINRVIFSGDVPVKEKVKDNQKIFTYIPEDVCVHEVTTFFNGKEIGKHSVRIFCLSMLNQTF